MLFKAMTLAVLATTLTASFSHAAKQELNGPSDYVALQRMDVNVNSLRYDKSRGNNFANPTNTNNGVGFAKDKGYLGTLGQDFGYVRTEVEIGAFETDVDTIRVGTSPSGRIAAATTMFNLAVEYSIDPGVVAGLVSGGGAEETGFSITPFISGGLGFIGGHGNVSYQQNGIDERDQDQSFMFAAPAGQWKAGLSLGLTHGVELTGSYNFMFAETFNQRGTDDVIIENVAAGLRYNF